MSLESQLALGVAAMGVSLPEGAVDRLAQYLRLLEKWNRVHNLTAVRDPEQMVTLHVLDSFSILPYLANAHTLVDVGTGAGLPGIPLAIARPDLRVTLLDSSHKKATFLEQARVELKLGNVAVVCERVERWHPQAKFDAVVSRAFAELADFVQGARHPVSAAGMMLGRFLGRKIQKYGRDKKAARIAMIKEKWAGKDEVSLKKEGADPKTLKDYRADMAFIEKVDAVKELRSKKEEGVKLTLRERLTLATSFEEDKNTAAKELKSQKTLNTIKGMGEKDQDIAVKALGIDIKKWRQNKGTEKADDMLKKALAER